MIVEKIYTDIEIKALQGEFFDLDNYNQIINKDIDVYTPSGSLLFSLRKKLIPKKITNIARKNLLPHTMKTKSNSRGTATGKVNLSTMSNSIVELLDPDNFKTRVRYDDGKVSQYKISNTCHSMIAGYYDKPIRNQIKNKCIRLTSFSQKNPEDWQNAIAYVKYLDQLYKSVLKKDYDIRKTKSKNCYTIDNTIFTTLTLNYNFRTACHMDKGNAEYSILTTLGKWKGCYLGYPQYGVAVNVEEGDFLIMNPYEYHCNTEFKGKNSDRMSIVTYSRSGIIN